jgi:hypothetical protein
MSDLIKAASFILIALFLACLVGGGVAFYYETRPTQPAPEAIEVERLVIQDRVITVVVKDTIVILATPAPVEQPSQPTGAVVVEAPAPLLTATPEPIQAPACVDAAWIVSQPVSDLQGSALEVGKLKRLRWSIRNEGSCIWDGYVLTSNGVFPDLLIPLTYPGEVAEIEYTFTVRQSLEARFYLMPPISTMASRGLFGVGNSVSPGGGMYYRLDTYQGRNVIQVPEALGGGTMCVGPG